MLKKATDIYTITHELYPLLDKVSHALKDKGTKIDSSTMGNIEKLETTKCPGVNKPWVMHALNYNTATKLNDPEPHVSIWMNLKT